MCERNEFHSRPPILALRSEGVPPPAAAVTTWEKECWGVSLKLKTLKGLSLSSLILGMGNLISPIKPPSTLFQGCRPPPRRNRQSLNGGIVPVGGLNQRLSRASVSLGNGGSQCSTGFTGKRRGAVGACMSARDRSPMRRDQSAIAIP
jgi:hypothetical protein